MTALLLALALAATPSAALAGAGTAALPAASATAGEKQKPRKSKYQPHALLFGTVFDEGGRLVRGAQVLVRPREGKGKWEARTDDAGEFAVHLPVGKAVYIVEARAPGMTPDRKEVEVSADERVDIVLHLKRP